MRELDIYRITLEDEKDGMKAMSLVTSPAIKSNFLKLSEDKKPSKVVLLKDETGEYKQIVAGLALIPNQLIYRFNEESNYEYYVYFEAEDIENIRNKFHKEKLTDNVNLQHSNEVVNAYLIESYIINSEERLAEVKAQGIEDAVMGAWYVQYKIEDYEVFEEALKGEFNGFSIEVAGQLVLQKFNNNLKRKDNFMSKFNDLIIQFKNVLAKFEDNTVTTSISDSDTPVIYGEIGEPVYTVVVSEESENKELLAAGEYVLSNGYTIVVDEAGNLVSLSKMEETTTEELEEDEPVVSTEPVVATEPEEVVEETATEMVVEGIEALIPKDENGLMLDGSYSVEVYVNNNAITYGSMYAYTYKDLELAQEQVKELTKEVEKLQNEPMAKPVVINEVNNVTKLSKEELKKMDNIQFHLHKLGLR